MSITEPCEYVGGRGGGHAFMHVPRCSGSHLLDGLDIVVDAPLVARQQPLLKDGLGAVKVEHQLGRGIRDEGGRAAA